MAAHRMISKKCDSWLTKIDKLSEWLNARGVKVVTGKRVDSRYEPSEKTIYLQVTKDKEEAFYTLLHECGHVLIEQNGKSFYRSYPSPDTVDWCDLMATKDVVQQVSIIAEELEAWNRGERLASRLGLEIQRRRWNKTRSVCVSGYMHYILG